MTAASPVSIYLWASSLEDLSVLLVAFENAAAANKVNCSFDKVREMTYRVEGLLEERRAGYAPAPERSEPKAPVRHMVPLKITHNPHLNLKNLLKEAAACLPAEYQDVSPALAKNGLALGLAIQRDGLAAPAAAAA